MHAAHANAEIAGAVATANALLRKLRHQVASNAADAASTGTTSTTPGTSSGGGGGGVCGWRLFTGAATDLPDSRDLPATLGAAMHELSALVSEQLLVSK